MPECSRRKLRKFKEKYRACSIQNMREVSMSHQEPVGSSKRNLGGYRKTACLKDQETVKKCSIENVLEVRA